MWLLITLLIIILCSFFVSVTMPLTREEKIFFINYLRQNHSKLCEQNFAGSLILTIIPRKTKFIIRYSNFKPQSLYTTSTRRQKIPDLAGSRHQHVLTMWMWWEILSERVRKSPSEYVSKNWVFHVHHCKESQRRLFSCAQNPDQA